MPAATAVAKVDVPHENPDRCPLFGAAFDAAGVEHEQWLLGEGALTWTPSRRPAFSGPG